jgi:Ca2+-transporting ATPase
MQDKKWHSMSAQETLKALKSSKNGLSEEEANKRLKKYGRNELPKRKGFTYIGVAFSQLKSPMVYVLLIAALISFFLKEYIDVYVILFAVFLNTIVGFIQEIKAEKALEALSSVIEHKVYVLRGGIEKEIDTRDITIGDVIVLKTGDRVPADGRILEAYELEVDEAVLTGESVPVQKGVEYLDQVSKTESKKNMVYMGSAVFKGRGHAVVTAVGLGTKFGQIADLIDKTEDADTPLQIELKRFSRSFGAITFCILVMVMAIGLYHSIPFLDIFTTAVAIAVAAIPEGLLVAVTIILAIGMQRILRSGSLVRKLIAAETLGSVSVICTDKTGTLTAGTMQLDHIVTANSFFKMDHSRNKVSAEEGDGDHMTALKIGMICNDAVIENPEAEMEDWVIHGGYTEKAFLIAGIHAGFDPEEINRVSVRVREIPFSSDRKFMATLNKEGDNYVIYAKGAAEEMVNRSSHVLSCGKIREMEEDDLRFFRQKQNEMSREGLRVLGVAFKRTDKKITADFNENNDEDIVNRMVLVGLVALKDPLRAEAKPTLDIAKEAGIRTIIITGDNPLTARALANELGMKIEDDNILEGEELDRISTKDFDNIVSRIKVYARVSPRHKSRIVDAWQARGEVVAMTGDGINDAPALKKADIGIALGSGTEVAKETANLVLLDDNFKTIVMAIREGRGIFDNIRKVVLYLISDSFSEVVIVAGALLANLPVPLTAAQILWVNLIGDSLPNVALTQDPEEEDVMKRKPRKKNEPLFNTEMKMLVVAISLVSGIVALLIFTVVYRNTGNIILASSIVFSIMSVDSLIYVFSLRSPRHSVFRQNVFSNPYLIVAIILSFLLQLIAIYVPFFQNILGTQALDMKDWEMVAMAGVFTVFIVEVIKYIFIKKDNQNG